MVAGACTKNLTPDPATGIGCWSDSEIVTAILTGVTTTPGEVLCVMPKWGMASSDVSTPLNATQEARTRRKIPTIDSSRILREKRTSREHPLATHFRKIIPLAAALSLAALAASASSSCSSSSAVGLDSTCSINSDCNSPLICAFAKCHNACRESRDCSAGERCVLTGTAGACQLPAESTCSGAGATCRGGQVCGGDQQCRQQCSASAPCPQGDFCLPSGAMSACFTPANATDVLALVGAGVISLDGSVIGDASPSAGPGDASGANGSTGDAANDRGSTVVPNTCPSAQTQFPITAQGDSNPSFTSGVGVRTATQLLIFSSYAGPNPDGGVTADGGTSNLVYVQAFDPTTASILGPAQPLFSAPDGTGFFLESASVAPTGQIALAFDYGGGPSANNQNSLYAAFVGPAGDAGGPSGVALLRPPLEIESAQIWGQTHIAWAVATGAFVYSWEYRSSADNLGTRSFRPSGLAAGGADPVPTDDQARANAQYLRAPSVAAGPDLFGVAFQSVSSVPSLTVLDLNGNQVGSAMPIGRGNVSGGPLWETVGATAEGFVYFYDDTQIGGASERFVPTSVDAGAILPDGGDAGLAGFTFAVGIGAKDAHAVNDDTGGIGGVGIALRYSNGVSFGYVNADGATHIGPLSVIAHTYAAADQMNITNFGGSFSLSLYSAASHSTQVAASGCP